MNMKMSLFFKRKWYIGLVLVVLAITIVLKLITPPVKPVIQSNLPKWNNLQVEVSTKNDIKKLYGTPLTESETTLGTQLTYPAERSSYPQEFVVDASNKVVFMKQRIPYSDILKYKDLFDSLGEADLIQYLPDFEEAFPLHVFLSKGIAMAYNTNDFSTFEIWYFKPTTKEEFLKTLGESNTDNPHGPEEITPANTTLLK